MAVQQNIHPWYKTPVFVTIVFVTILLVSFIIYSAFDVRSAKNYFPYAGLLATIVISSRHKHLAELPMGKLALYGLLGGIAFTVVLLLVNLIFG